MTMTTDSQLSTACRRSECEQCETTTCVCPCHRDPNPDDYAYAEDL